MNESGFHSARDFVGYGAHPPNPRWPGGARLALNIVVNYEEGSEISIPDGDGKTETSLIEGGSGDFVGRDLGDPDGGPDHVSRPLLSLWPPRHDRILGPGAS